MTANSASYTEVPVDVPSPTAEKLSQCKVYRRRWLMLVIFMVYSLGNSIGWLEYSSITNVISRFYSVSSYAVDWTSTIFLVVYIPLVFPASYLVDKLGLRKCIMMGSGLTVLGSWIKCASVSPELFWVTFLGQTFVAIGQIFMLQLPPQVASVWFDSHQVSTACSLGVFGNQLGLGLSFLVIPIAVRNHPDIVDIGTDLARMFYFLAAFNTAIFFAIVTMYQDKPPLPPSIEVAKKMGNTQEFVAPIRRLFRSKNFLLSMTSYSLILGVFNAFSTLLSQFILKYFEGGQEFAGRVGVVFIIGGMVGSIIGGYVLDRTHRFKETSLVLYSLSTAFLLITTFIMATRSEIVIYIIGGIFGACTGGYMPVGLEFAAEITYPESEGTTAGILLAASSATGIIFTLLYAWLFNVTGDVWANIALVVILTMGTGLTAITKADLRRQAAHTANQQKEETDDS